MTLHATFRGGPADGTDRRYPHITQALPALWWTPDAPPSSTAPRPLGQRVLPRQRSVERGGPLAAHNGATLIDPNNGAAYRLCCADPARDDVWVYVVIDPPLRQGPNHPR